MNNQLSKLFLAFKAINRRRVEKRREMQRTVHYRKWLAKHELMDDARRAKLKQRYSQLANKPLISIIMPVYNAQLGWLEDAIQSVQKQTYQEWELCIADDCSTHADVRPYLEAKRQADPRIKVVFRPGNGHISAASNSAIELAQGEFLALMDQDDLLPEDALLQVAHEVNAHPDAGLLYSDEDKVDEQGLRESPTRKKKWGLDCLLRFNSISHLGVYRTELVRRIGGFRIGYEGSQDHDLALRCIEHLRRDQIVHIPKILYHWRTHADSTARTAAVKPYAVAARLKAIEDHLARTKAPAQETS